MRALLAVLLVALIAAPAAHADVPVGNLLVNGDAEAVAGSPDGSTLVAPPGWTVTGEFTEVSYTAPSGFPTAADAARLGGGANFFAGGNMSPSTATQVVDLTGAAPQIDAGLVSAQLSALIGGYLTQNDSATITATFVGPAGPLGNVVVGPVTAAQRNGVTDLLPQANRALVPAGTRSISVLIDGERTDGSYNDSYVDNVSLTLAPALPAPTPTPTPTPTPPPTPQYHQSVVVHVVSGSVLVRRPGTSTFVAVTGSQGVPLGSIVDTRHGKLTLTSVPKPGGKAETATFYDGLFKVTQIGSITQLALVETLAPCDKHGKAAVAAKKPKSRKLWGDGGGSFRTRGQYSSATVRGTRWLVQDSCAGTLTKVVKGVVSVSDFRRHRTVLVKAGKQYVAKP